jgi:hypothetical protein
MSRVSIIALIAAILNTTTTTAQNYPAFLHEAEQVLANEFEKMERQDRQQWRQQQEWRLLQADEEDDAICRRVQNQYRYTSVNRISRAPSLGCRAAPYRD